MADTTELYSVEGWVRTWLDHKYNVVRVKWYNYTSMVHVRESCIAQLAALEKYGVTIIVADASEATGHPYPQDQEWFENNLYPRSLELGLKLIISVMPKNIIARSGSQTWMSTAQESGLKYLTVGNSEEVEEVLEMVVAQEKAETGVKYE